MSQPKATEASAIQSIHVSHRQRYLLVLRKDHPIELWDLTTETMIRGHPPYANVSVAEWSPLLTAKKRDRDDPAALPASSPPAPSATSPSAPSATPSGGEHFILHLADGTRLQASSPTPHEGAHARMRQTG